MRSTDSAADREKKAVAISSVIAAVALTRARKSGPAVFVDVIVGVARDAGVERAHDISDQVEASVRAAVPGADVVVHVEPCADKSDPLTLARVVASRHGMGAHSLRICDEKDGRTVELHLEVSGSMSLTEAHDLASRFEAEIRESLPGVSSVVTHLEPCGICPCPVANDPGSERRVQTALLAFQGVEKTVFNAHDLTVRLEKHLRAAVPELGRVVIHAEPPEDAA
jgi:divalent metal cation (Fe/Co/Zn/Cd) transporter